MGRKYVTPAEYRALVTGSPVRQYSDEVLNSYIEIATANVEAYTERVFEAINYTEVFRGDNSRTYLVLEYPIISITSLTQNTVANPPVSTAMDISSRLVRTTDNNNMGRIELDGLDTVTNFSAANLYTIVYRGGFESIPVTVKHATALWTSELMRPDYGGAQSRVPEIIPLTSEQIAEMLNPLRRRRLG